MNGTLLIIEDDLDLLEGLAFSMEKEGCRVLTAKSCAEGRKVLKTEPCSCILLDCNLPDGSGFDFCRQVKERREIPILMLTARDTEMDEVKALELGMDDFMSKPFSLAVLKARLRKLMQKERKADRLVSGGIVVDKDRCRVFRGEEEISCSRIEYQLLVYFMENKNQVLSKEQILASVWDSQGRFVDDSTVSVNIRRLRAKIENDPKNPERIRNVYGIGYIWREDGV